MGLTSKQPHVEFWNTECYGPKAYGEVPGNGKQAFAMITTLFGGQSRGEVRLHSADPTKNPIVDHKHFSDPLDLLVLSEGCRLVNEIVVEGVGTKDVIKGSWPQHLTHHTQKDRSEWEAYVQREADTCKRNPPPTLALFNTHQHCYPQLTAHGYVPRLPSRRHLQNGQR